MCACRGEAWALIQGEQSEGHGFALEPALGLSDASPAYQGSAGTSAVLHGPPRSPGLSRPGVRSCVPRKCLQVNHPCFRSPARALRRAPRHPGAQVPQAPARRAHGPSPRQAQHAPSGPQWPWSLVAGAGGVAPTRAPMVGFPAAPSSTEEALTVMGKGGPSSSEGCGACRATSSASPRRPGHISGSWAFPAGSLTFTERGQLSRPPAAPLQRWGSSQAQGASSRRLRLPLPPNPESTCL